MPVGDRFHPTDDEIISHYLTKKMNGDSHVDRFIGEIDPCKFEPWKLPGEATRKSNDQVWYFFCRPNYKNLNSKKKRNRTTSSGSWKLTGKKRDIMAKGTKVGTKSTLVFHPKDRKDSKNNWVIHEYQAETVHPNQEEFVVIKVKNKADVLSEHSPQDGGESGIIGTPIVGFFSEEDNKIIDDAINAANTVEDLKNLLLEANILGNNDGASTSRTHINEDKLDLAAFVTALLNVPDSGTSQTDELFYEQVKGAKKRRADVPRPKQPEELPRAMTSYRERRVWIFSRL